MTIGPRLMSRGPILGPSETRTPFGGNRPDIIASYGRRMSAPNRDHALADLVAQIDIAMALRQQGRNEDAAAVLESAYATAHSLGL
jgi:hypothetical protein